MNKIPLAIICFLTISFRLSSQEANKTKEYPLNLGMHVMNFHRDFGMGIHLTTPTIAHKSIAGRLRANVQWHEHLDGSEYTWSPYLSFQAGLIGMQLAFDERIKLYGEGGLLVVKPSEKFSSKNLEFGGYGLFGFEFMMIDKHNSYFIEIGGGGSGSKADRTVGSPIYANGFLVQAGWRVQF